MHTNRSHTSPLHTLAIAAALMLGACAHSTSTESGGTTPEGESTSASTTSAVVAPTECTATDLGDDIIEYRIAPLGWAYRTVGAFELECGPDDVEFHGGGVALSAMTFDRSIEPVDVDVTAAESIRRTAESVGATVADETTGLVGEAETPARCARLGRVMDGVATETWFCVGWVELDETNLVWLTIAAHDTAESWAGADLTLEGFAGAFFDNLLTPEDLAAE